MESRIVWKLSTGNLGGGVTSNVLGSDLFHDLSADENATGGFDYRCAFLCNDNPNTFDQVTIRVDNPIIHLGLDPAGVMPLVGAQAAIISGPRQQPVGVDFQDTPLILASIPPRSCVAIWFRRSIDPLQAGETVVFRLITAGI